MTIQEILMSERDTEFVFFSFKGHKTKKWETTGSYKGESRGRV